MYFKDLTEYTYYLPSPFSDVWNIGWLDPDHEFPLGRCPQTVCITLDLLLKNEMPNVAAQVNPIRGNHPCLLCNPSLELRPNDVLGFCELWIPATTREGIYAAPSMILHYIKSHGYLPPAEFLDALELLTSCEMFDGQLEFEKRNNDRLSKTMASK